MLGGAGGGGGSAQAASKSASPTATAHELVFVADITKPPNRCSARRHRRCECGAGASSSNYRSLLAGRATCLIDAGAALELAFHPLALWISPEQLAIDRGILAKLQTLIGVHAVADGIVEAAREI